MITGRLRDALAAFSLLVIIGGPIFTVLGVVAMGFVGTDRFGEQVGAAIEFAAASIIGGGVLRLLVSIDARLEAGR